MRSAQVTFDLNDLESERTFLQTYMVPAWDRFHVHESFDCGWFWRFGTTSHYEYEPIELEDGTRVDDGGVILVINGEPTPKPLLEQERQAWTELERNGVIDG